LCCRSTAISFDRYAFACEIDRAIAALWIVCCCEYFDSAFRAAVTPSVVFATTACAALYAFAACAAV
jgi:hypothetical protein